MNTTVRSVCESACFYIFMQTSSMVNYIVHYRHNSLSVELQYVADLGFVSSSSLQHMHCTSGHSVHCECMGCGEESNVTT